jgi:hypothetical protein
MLTSDQIFQKSSSSCTSYIKLSPKVCGEVTLKEGKYWCDWFNDWCYVTGKRSKEEKKEIKEDLVVELKPEEPRKIEVELGLF